MTKKPVRRRRRAQPVPPEKWLGSITLNDLKHWVLVMAPIVFSVWAFAGPYVDAKAEQLLKEKLIVIGMDPGNIQSLNSNLSELQSTVKELDRTKNEAAEELRKQIEAARGIGEKNSQDLQQLKQQNDLILQLLLGAQQSKGEVAK